MKAKLSPFIQEQLRKIEKKDIKLFLRIEKQIKLFENNPKHPSLRIHKLRGNLGIAWSLSVSKNFRLIYKLLHDDIAYFLDIGTHDEVYKK